MATKLEITRQSYTHYEAAKREPDLETIEKLATIFEVSTDYLLGHNEFETSATHKLRLSHTRRIDAEMIELITKISFLSEERQKIIKQILQAYVEG